MLFDATNIMMQLDATDTTMLFDAINIMMERDAA